MRWCCRRSYAYARQRSESKIITSALTACAKFQTYPTENEMVEKVNLDRVAAQIVHDYALRENRTASNAASTLIRRAASLARQSPATHARDHS